MLAEIALNDCHVIPTRSNPDGRGCLYEIYRDSWEGAFVTKQWNACVSNAGVVRGVHVHADYHEFYTLPRGRVLLGLADIRRESSTFGQTVQFEWAASDASAVVVPIGVAHVMYFLEDSVLAFGLSDFWVGERDVLGCEWDVPEMDFQIPADAPVRSRRDQHSGGFDAMVAGYEGLRATLGDEGA